MEIISYLEKIGFNTKEALVYKALLELGQGSVSVIAKKANIKRPTAYLVLENLRKKDLLLVIPKPKKKVYIAESPAKLRKLITEKQEALDDILPYLNASFSKAPEKPNIKYYEGGDQIIGIYDNILNSAGVWFFGSIKESMKNFPEYFVKFVEESKKRNIKIKEIIGSSQEDIDYMQTYSNFEHHEIHLLPKGSPYSFKTDCAIWENKIAIFSYQLMFVVLIESKDVAESYKALFELAWKNEYSGS